MNKQQYKAALTKLQLQANDINDKINELTNTYHQEVLANNNYKKGDIITYNGFKYVITGLINLGNFLYLKGYNVKDNNKENIIINIKVKELT